MFALSLFVIAGVLAGGYAYTKHPKFGKLPEGERLQLIRGSANYAAGEFRNLAPTSMFTDGSTVASVVIGDLLSSKGRLAPTGPLRTIKTDLKGLDRAKDTLVWFGHSSYFVQLGGKRILIDPVFSSSAAPVPTANNAFEGTTVYTAEDMPEIDYLLITHDHWDHLDYPSVRALEPKTRRVVGGLGIGAYLEHWGYAKDKIQEGDWYDTLHLENSLTVHIVPARHYSGRLFRRNQTLWVGYALETPKRRLFFSGDSGYGPHFGDIARRLGGFDLAVLDAGQYDARWAYIHMTPEEAARAAEDLKAKALLPAHVGRFSIARHSWDDPFKRISAASEAKSFRLLTPAIGEPLDLQDETKRFSRWWESVEGLHDS